MASESVPLGWYPDPTGRRWSRFWDGHQWREFVDGLHVGEDEVPAGLTLAPPVPGSQPMAPSEALAHRS